MMSVKKALYARNAVLFVLLNNGFVSLLAVPASPKKIKISLPNLHKAGHRDIEITIARLKNDILSIKKYIEERVANDIKRAKRWGKGMATTFGGITGYVFDAIPFEFFNDKPSRDEAFKHLEEGVNYIRELKEQFKKNIQGSKRKINQTQLAEFLYGNIVDKLSITDAQKVLLRKEPLCMDEFVRKGIVKRSEYMYYTLLNFVIRYYLEQELKK